ncbi:hypothetical protein I552_3251 [Mycobacterium xenopi 3993]|nr:hypothetical protein I552_3251 [Mycobacterium xenopi 3993]
MVAAVAHGELLTLAPFGSADGVVARAVSRLVTVATGLDPHGLGVPEVYWMRRAAEYRDAAAASPAARPKASGPGCCCAAARCKPVRARRCRSPTPWRVVSRAGRKQAHAHVKRATIRMVSARRPLARNSVTKRATSGCVGWPRRSCEVSGCNPTQRVVDTVRSSQLRRPATLLPLSRL